MPLQEIDYERDRLFTVELLRRAYETIRQQRFTIGCQAAIIETYREQERFGTLSGGVVADSTAFPS